MGILYLTYIYTRIVDGVMGQGWISDWSILSSNSSPYIFILFSALIIAFVYLLVKSQNRRLIITRRALKEKEQTLNLIETQKIELELKDKNITDSLIYAQRIQEARLPSETYFRKHFEDSFIFFK